VRWRDGTGRWGRNAPASPDNEWLLKDLARVTPEPDTDGDGMPDSWEQTMA